MNILFVGPQGSGKGTQAQIIAKQLHLAHISTGDLLRSAQGELKKEIDAVINSGKLVSDELMIKILKERLSHQDTKNGFILDGFPRNLSQAKALDKIAKIDKVVEIAISDDESVSRLSGRLTCSKCSAIFNTKTNPPKQNMVCDICKSHLKIRADDTEEAIRKRLDIYHKETEQILEHYPDALIRINGEQPIERVTEDILNSLE